MAGTFTSGNSGLTSIEYTQFATQSLETETVLALPFLAVGVFIPNQDLEPLAKALTFVQNNVDQYLKDFNNALDESTTEFADKVMERFDGLSVDLDGTFFKIDVIEGDRFEDPESFLNHFDADEDDVKIQLAVVYDDIQFMRMTIPLFDLEPIAERLLEINGEQSLAA